MICNYFCFPLTQNSPRGSSELLGTQGAGHHLAGTRL